MSELFVQEACDQETVKSAERDDGIKPEAARTSGSHFEDTSQHGPERIVEIA